MGDYLDGFDDDVTSGDFVALPPREPRDIATPPRWDQIPESGRIAWREGALPTFVPATVPRRMLSWFVDAALVVAAFAMAAAVDVRVWDWMLDRRWAVFGSIVVATATLRSFTFAAWGRSPGLALCRLGVVTHGYPGRVAWKAAGWRWFVCLIYAAGPVGVGVGVGFVSLWMMVRRPDRVTVHDWVAGTVIVERWDRFDEEQV